MIFLLLPRLSSHVMPTWAYSILREQDRDTKQKTNRIQRLPYLKGTHTIGFLPAKLQLFHKPARGWGIFLFLPRHQQPCHPCAGLCGGLGSMSAVFACEKTHICPWADPGLLAGRPGFADKKTRVFFCTTPGGLSRHVIPALTCAEARDLCLRPFIIALSS